MKVFTGLLCLGLLALIREGESAPITAWTTPVIGSGTGSGTVATKIPENLAAGTSTEITLAVTGGPAVAFEITGQPTASMFTIANSGLITFAVGSLDYETKASYVITVKAKDDAAGTNTGVATVKLEISDVNEFTPTFGADSYSLTVANATVGHQLLPALATDGDGTAVITYTLTSGNDDGMFKISSSKALQVAKALAANTNKKYELVINAADGGTPPLSSSVTVTVCHGSCSCSAAVPTAVVGIMTMLIAIMAATV